MKYDSTAEQAAREEASLRRAFPDLALGVQASVSGEVSFVRSVNESTGWGFGRLWVKETKTAVSFTGIVEDLYNTAVVTCKGVWKQHARFGWQLDCAAILIDLPADLDGTRAWLMDRFPDIGPQRSKALLAAFPPPGLWDVLERTPERLLTVEGIGEKLADQIVKSYQLVKYEREAYTTLAGLGLKADQIRKAISRWGRDAATFLSEDLYNATEIGLSFKQADVLARRAGVRGDDPRRIQRGYVAAMRKLEHDGHTCAKMAKIQSIASSSDVLGLRIQPVIDQWEEVIERELLVPFDADEVYWGRAVVDAQEHVIAQRILDLIAVGAPNG